ncbi:MAG: M48 family metallopeptidase, partial [Burkholderiaceae bacterium]|nr:M48 family metallopeptidase [Burkholderiaceae bacterium]
MTPLKYLQAYPPELQAQVRELIERRQLGAWLMSRYPQAHGIRSDGALYAWVSDLKAQYLRGAAPIDKVAFDSKLQVIAQALGTHTAHSRVQGGRLKAKHEIRIAAVFRDAPLPFLRMITVHEL